MNTHNTQNQLSHLISSSTGSDNLALVQDKDLPLSSLSDNRLWHVKPKDRLTLLSTRPNHTRVAPSPTGYMHLGTLRTAWHNFLLAKQSKGTFLLRVDNTDLSRNSDHATQMIFDMMDHYQLSFDRQFYQSDRFTHYQTIASHLVDAGMAFVDCGKTMVSIPCGYRAQFFDVAGGQQDIPVPQPFMTILRDNGTPTYHFASVLDDIDYRINFILRGSDHLMNTPKHIFLAQLLANQGYAGAQDFLDHIVFAHLGLITQQRVKLSKRDDASNLLAYQDLPIKAVLHWALMLGWGHPQSNFDQLYPVFHHYDFFMQGGFKSANMDINLSKLQSLCKAYKKAGL